MGTQFDLSIQAKPTAHQLFSADLNANIFVYDKTQTWNVGRYAYLQCFLGKEIQAVPTEPHT